MLAPEVWAFDPPGNGLKVCEGSLDSCADIDAVVKGHHFNHLVRETIVVVLCRL